MDEHVARRHDLCVLHSDNLTLSFLLPHFLQPIMSQLKVIWIKNSHYGYYCETFLINKNILFLLHSANKLLFLIRIVLIRVRSSNMRVLILTIQCRVLLPPASNILFPLPSPIWSRVAYSTNLNSCVARHVANDSLKIFSFLIISAPVGCIAVYRHSHNGCSLQLKLSICYVYL